MVAVMLRVGMKVLHPEIGREIDDKPGSGTENLCRNPGRLTVLQAEKDNVLATGYFRGCAACESGAGQ